MEEKNVFWKSIRSINTTRSIIFVVTVLVFLGLGLWWFFVSVIGNLIFDHETEQSIEHFQKHAENDIGPSNTLFNWRDQENTFLLKEFVNNVASVNDVSNVNVFNQDRVVVGSLEEKKIGIISEEENVTRALNGELVKQFVSNEEEYSTRENDSLPKRHTVGDEGLFEVYMPLRDSSGRVIGALEVYLDQAHHTLLVRKLQNDATIFIFIAVVFIGTSFYLTFRNKNKRIARQAEEFSSIIDYAPIGICKVNQKGIVESANPKMVELFGKQHPENINGESIFKLISCEKSDIDDLIHKGLQGQFFEKEIKDSCQAKKELYQHYYGVPINRDKKIVDGLLLLVEDVTNRKQLELELEKHSKNLELKVSERTMELEEKISELSKLNKLMVDRELKMVELKEKIQELKTKTNISSKNSLADNPQA